MSFQPFKLGEKVVCASDNGSRISGVVQQDDGIGDPMILVECLGIAIPVRREKLSLQSTPLPRGFIRVTSSYSGLPLLFPAAHVMASPCKSDASGSGYGQQLPSETLIDCFPAHPDISGWKVVETLEEVQDALVKALGAQTGGES